ncbi:Hypothetical predicted protein [Olea europaea subsp. europaea]|uniref:Uncharacterized protein n=1 Tax=Olea europaea subsp. europaea TaxID=158383 RepID=A0A8S0TM17_OLEEU|nr:Hypothetical predicted protein [Olea europaea subsp. europaea]
MVALVCCLARHETQAGDRTTHIHKQSPHLFVLAIDFVTFSPRRLAPSQARRDASPARVRAPWHDPRQWPPPAALVIVRVQRKSVARRETSSDRKCRSLCSLEMARGPRRDSDRAGSPWDLSPRCSRSRGRAARRVTTRRRTREQRRAYRTWPRVVMM